MRIALIANTAWYLFNFRVGLIEKLQAGGNDIITIAPHDAYVEKLERMGIRHREWKLSGASKNPVKEVAAIYRLRCLMKEERIESILSFTPKGNIYSSFASYKLSVDYIPNISGLGSMFVNNSMLTSIVKTLYRFSLRKAQKIFFQNNEDMNVFLKLGLVTIYQAERIPGSGVNLKKFQFYEKPITEKPRFIFLLVARLLWEKGLGQYVEAGRLVKSQFPNVELHVVGFLDMLNPAAIPESQISSWHSEGDITYHGSTDDVAQYMRVSDCVVLPSYYKEGVPRSLLEAAAMGIPVITTNEPGCRDVVDPGITGFLCKSRDSMDLAEKMKLLLRMSMAERFEMGKRASAKIIDEFDENFVIDRYLAVLQDSPSDRY